ncbi:MAG: glutamate racemase, partial [Pseudomonas sp.]
PYGNKPAGLLIDRAEELTRFLVARNVKAIVIACNTATAAAITTLRERYHLPIVGVEPGIKPATQVTITGVTGILATQRTIDSEKFQTLLNQFSQSTTIIPQPCPGLAEAIDEGGSNLALRKQLIHHFTAPLLAQGADTLVLGCTQYPCIADEIRAVVGDLVHLIDTSAAIARQVVRQLETNGIVNGEPGAGTEAFYSSDISSAANPDKRQAALGEIFSWYLNRQVEVQPLTAPLDSLTAP